MGSYYSLQGMSLALSIYNFPEDYTNRPFIKLKALRYLFAHRKRYGYKAPSVKALFSFANTLFDLFHRRNDIDSMREVADIVNQYIPNANFLDRIRQLENEQMEEKIGYRPVNTQGVQGAQGTQGARAHGTEPHIPTLETPIKTVYNDSQNVHNSKINRTVINILTSLYDKYKDIITLKGTTAEVNFRHKKSILSSIETSLTDKYPFQKELIYTFSTYIKESTANFGEGLSMLDAFLSIWLWIRDHKHREELEKRLLEEMKEMNGHCTTGHLARLMNVIQGFTEDESLCIRISDKDQCISVVKTYLTNELVKCEDEEVIAQMTEGGEVYVKFIRKSIAKKLLEWKTTYGDKMLNHIAEAVNKFAQTTIFSV